MIELAYAKINVGLNITGKMENGFHELDSIMVPIDLHDTIKITKSNVDSFESNVDLLWDEHNLIYRAIQLMREHYNLKGGLSVSLTKRIPQEAGLGGGSADAAAVLRLINRLYDLKLSKGELARLGLELGSDVPFCIYQKPARCKGRGEVINVLPPVPNYKVVLIKPSEGVATATAFELADKRNDCHPDMDKIEEAFVSGKDLADILGNSLEPGAIELVPAIGTIKQECINRGFSDVVMTGSGSTVVVLCERGRHVSSLVTEMKKKYDFVLVGEILNNI